MTVSPTAKSKRRHREGMHHRPDRAAEQAAQRLALRCHRRQHLGLQLRRSAVEDRGALQLRLVPDPQVHERAGAQRGGKLGSAGAKRAARWRGHRPGTGGGGGGEGLGRFGLHHQAGVAAAASAGQSLAEGPRPVAQRPGARRRGLSGW